MEKRKDVDITIDWENGDAQVYSAPEVLKLFLIATILGCLLLMEPYLQMSLMELYPGLLKRWYPERKELQS